VTVAEVTGFSKGMQALLGGNADIGAGSLEQSIQMAAEGRPVQALVTEFFNTRKSLYSQDGVTPPLSFEAVKNVTALSHRQSSLGRH
jgi:hypothetical protein